MTAQLQFIHVAFGGGTNSTAMLCGMRDRGMRPSLITFADTGAEMPYTLEHVAAMDAQAQAWWGVPIQTVRKLYAGKFEGIAAQCERQGNMPSIAYGRRSCSMKYKHAPQDQALKKAMREAGVTEAIRWIGYDAGEGHRIKPAHLKPVSLTKKLTVLNQYPLVDWQWRREDCAKAIKRHGLALPGKSSCFICTSMKKREVFRLRDEFPDLMERALKIEAVAQAGLRTKRGLGGENNLWVNWLMQDAQQCKLGLDIEPVHTPCGCYDGGE